MVAESLPTELLIKIFKLTRQSRQEAIDFGKISLNHNAWGLARVCGRWRATVLDMPCMWSDLVISIPTGTPPWVNYPIPLLKEQIERSGDDPMHVALISQEIPGYTTAKIFTAIVESCPRWETLDLFSKTLLPTESLLYMRNRIPLLREIHICADSERGYVGGHIFEHAPSLKTVHITEPRLHADNRNMDFMSVEYDSNYNDSFMWPTAPPFDPVFPFAQLTHYESQCKHPNHFDALCLAQNLTVCQATVVDHRHPNWRPPTTLVRFAHLHTLTLFAPAALLDQLAFPLLQNLFIESYPPDFPSVVAMLLRSNCSLRKFWMKAHPPAAQYAAILRANPAIEELGIIGRESLRHLYGACPNIDQIIDCLREDNPSGALVPQLRAFCFHDQATDLDVRRVVDMVQGRMQSARTVRLERLRVTECESRVFPVNARQRIAQLENMGLQVEYKREHERWLARGLLEYV
ncbi:hypothetical protein B0H16DRAFT_1897681 [Mycena metata]|uniref:F-box domain-containing protein n=1 Tax=Mycena metata TaxID=1033252 RepID=A0AAD7HDG7_9AGAR|nr:hypothetical protein B0H16DRAFT_1897681 [Mycena metata]